MSYCRWSCENFQSDIYCYEDYYGGIMIHVAAKRIAEPLPEMPIMNRENVENGSWLAAHNRNMAILGTIERKPIGLPCDGESFHVATHQQAVDKLLELRDMGYQVPEFALKHLREEAQECSESSD